MCKYYFEPSTCIIGKKKPIEFIFIFQRHKPPPKEKSSSFFTLQPDHALPPVPRPCLKRKLAAPAALAALAATTIAAIATPKPNDPAPMQPPAATGNVGGVGDHVRLLV